MKTLKEQAQLLNDKDGKIMAFGLTTRVWTYNERSEKFGCSECCTGDRCDEDCTAVYKGRRSECPHCRGKGWIPISEVIEIFPLERV